MAGLYYDPRTKQYSTIDEKRPEQQIVRTVVPTSEQRAATPSYANTNTQINAGGVRQPIRTDTPESTVQDAMQRIADYGQFTAPYQAQQDAAARAVTQRQPFSYDSAADPAWQAYKKEYVREGRRATEDTLGRYAAMTGGMPSTAAMTAASQAGDYYNAKLTDKLPELYRLAYDMYSDEANRTMSELSALRSLNSDAYGRWTDAYGRLGDLYTIGSKERAYADAAQDRQAKADAAKLYAYGDGEPYEIGSGKGQYFVLNAAPGDSMTGGDGSAWRKNGDGSVIITRDGQTWRIAAPASSGGGSGRGGGGGKRTAADGFVPDWYDDEQRRNKLFTDAYASGVASNYISTHYKDYGYDKASGLTAEYNKWLKSMGGRLSDVPTDELTRAGGFGSDGLYSPTFGFDASVLGGMLGRDLAARPSDPTSLDYSQDEGVFTWGGNTYNSTQALANAIDRAKLTDDEKKVLARKLSIYGFDVEFA